MACQIFATTHRRRRRVNVIDRGKPFQQRRDDSSRRTCNTDRAIDNLSRPRSRCAAHHVTYARPQHSAQRACARRSHTTTHRPSSHLASSHNASFGSCLMFGAAAGTPLFEPEGRVRGAARAEHQASQSATLRRRTASSPVRKMGNSWATKSAPGTSTKPFVSCGFAQLPRLAARFESGQQLGNGLGGTPRPTLLASSVAASSTAESFANSLEPPSRFELETYGLRNDVERLRIASANP